MSISTSLLYCDSFASKNELQKTDKILSDFCSYAKNNSCTVQVQLLWQIGIIRADIKFSNSLHRLSDYFFLIKANSNTLPLE